MRRSFLYCTAYENRHGKKEATILHLSVSERKFEAGMELELGAGGAQGEDLTLAALVSLQPKIILVKMLIPGDFAARLRSCHC